jgi:hypothetical protein
VPVEPVEPSSDLPVEPVEPSSDLPVEPVEPVGSEVVPPFDAGGADPEPARLDTLRSFFAQPDPLKWTAGAEIDLRIVAPHTGQCDGPWPWTPWTTSTSWPQAEQT